MKWIEAKVIFESDSPEIAGDLISNIFYELGLYGAVFEEPGIEPEEGWGDDALKPPDYYSVSGYFPQNELTDNKCRVLEEKLAGLEKDMGISCKTAYRKVDEEDWAESWKAFFWPEKISKKIVVKPAWREYYPRKDEIVLEIDPGMAFGTGTHPTTSLCIQMIEKYLTPGDTFLDVGTGSGILMLAAAKLGAEKGLGIDIDEVAAEIAGKNLLKNRIDTKKFKVKTGYLVDLVEERFDLIAANILSEVIVTLLDNIKHVLADDGIFICSGIIEENRELVLEKMGNTGFEILEATTKEAWVAIAGKLKNVTPGHAQPPKQERT